MEWMLATTMENIKHSGNLSKYFALCESCFWSASILLQDPIVRCPNCKGGIEVALIPLGSCESYRLSIRESIGLDVSFSITKKSGSSNVFA